VERGRMGDRQRDFVVATWRPGRGYRLKAETSAQ
jgi:hypothetical protein